MEPTQLLLTALGGLVAGIVYASYGILTKKKEGEPVNPRKAARTVILFGTAGVLVAFRPAEVTQANIQAALPDVAVVGIAFDMAWSRAQREGWIPDVLRDTRPTA